MKATLTPAEHARVNRVMGSPDRRDSASGRRGCRCGTSVPWTPTAMWEHTLTCERARTAEARLIADIAAVERRTLNASLELDA